MDNNVYTKLAKVLDSLPNGFPSTKSGIEIKILKKVFEPEEADLFCDLRLSFENAEQISKRTGRPLEGLEEKLERMWQKGQIFGAKLGHRMVFKMVPWIVGIYEYQINRMDREFAEMCDEYNDIYLPELFDKKTKPIQVVPIEKEISNTQEALPYEQVSALIESSKSFGVADCICKKEKGLLDNQCDKPMEICLGLAPIPGIFENHHWGRSITKEEAYDIIKKAEEEGLVHLTSNVAAGQYFICNCCGCCCGVLRTLNRLGISTGVNSHYYAEIDTDACEACGICSDERCQVEAVIEDNDTYQVVTEKCIGCGLCVSTCPAEAIKLVRKTPGEQVEPFKDEMDFFKVKARERGVDISQFE